MPRKVEGRKYITVEFTEEEYEQIKILAAKSNTSMNNVIRNFTAAGLNGTVTENNIDVLAPIIREQLKSVVEPMIERTISLNAKTCIQAGTAAYLCADTILKFVPPVQRTEVQESYEAARKKAVAFLKGKVDLSE